MYPLRVFSILTEKNAKTIVQRWLRTVFIDPLVNILIKESHFTKIQAETLLIDILAENISNKQLSFDEKSSYRLIKSGVSRGSFNRSLAQARKNIIKSIYTIILLGYLGILETPCLEPYIKLSNKIRNYAEAYRKLANEKSKNSEQIKIMKMLQIEIENSLIELNKPKSLSKKP
jgi:hypothetical protein